MKKYVQIKTFVELLCQLKKITIRFNRYMKSDKTCITYADLESLIKILDNCKNNPGKSSTTNIGEHIPCGHSTSTIWTFYNIENKHSLYSI